MAIFSWTMDEVSAGRDMRDCGPGTGLAPRVSGCLSVAGSEGGATAALAGKVWATGEEVGAVGEEDMAEGRDERHLATSGNGWDFLGIAPLLQDTEARLSGATGA